MSVMGGAISICFLGGLLSPFGILFFISILPQEDQREWHKMTRMTRSDCAVMCKLINTHTHTLAHTEKISPQKSHLSTNLLRWPREMRRTRRCSRLARARSVPRQ